MEPRADIHFDGWTLHPGSGELVKDGKRVRLQEQPLQILESLLARPGDVVTREQLIARLWPKGIVDFETGLNTAVRKLRAALGDEADTPRYIETLPRRGYRFIGTLDPRPENVAGSSHSAGAIDTGKTRTSRTPHDRRRSKVALFVGGGIVACGLAVAFFLSRPKAPSTTPPHPPIADSLAVLPFKPLLPEARNAALELGMADTLIAQLSNLPGVKVSPLSSVRPYDTVDQDPLVAGRALRVETVLDGSIQTDQKRIRVSARLLRVADGSALWSRQFDEPMSDIFALQDAIATQVVQALAITLSGAAQQRMLRPQTSSLDAYQHYVSGLYKWQRRLPEATEDFEAALREDSNYALAWSGLSSALTARAVYGYDPPGKVFQRAKEAAQKSIALDSQLAAGPTALGHVLVQFEHRYAEGEQLYLAALQMKPDDAPTWQRLAVVRAYQGHIREALTAIRRAEDIEPTTLSISVNVGMMLYMDRAYDEALAHLKRLLELDPQLDVADSVIGRVLVQKGDYDGALEHFRARTQPTPGGEGDFGRAYASAGRVAEAHAEMTRLEQRAREGFGVAYDLATIHAALGEIPQACAALKRAVDDDSQLIGFLKLDPAIDNLRGEKCYSDVARQLYGEW